MNNNCTNNTDILHHEKVKITNSGWSPKSYKEYKIESRRQTDIYMHTGGEIGCVGGVNIPYWPVIPVVNPILGRRSYP